MRAPSGISSAASAVRVALAVPALVVRADDVEPVALEERDAAEHLLAEHRVRLHQAPLVLGRAARLPEDLVGDPDLADVVEQEAVLARSGRRASSASIAARELDRVALHALRVRAACRVSFDSSALASAATVSR